MAHSKSQNDTLNEILSNRDREVISTEELLSMLYGKCVDDEKNKDGFITVTAFDPLLIQHIPVTDIHYAAEKICTLGQSQNTYYSLALRKPGLSSKRRGGLEHLQTMVCLAADIDIKGPAHKETELPETLEDALKFLLEIPLLNKENEIDSELAEDDTEIEGMASYLTPTIIVDSGYGIHALWLFNTPVCINADDEQGKENLDLAHRISDGFGLYIIERGHQHGWTLDMVGDLPRMLRAPGSYNYKLPDHKPFCHVIYSNGPRYELEDFEVYKDFGGAKSGGTAKRVASKGTADNSYYDSLPKKAALGSADRLEKCAFIQHCINDAKALPEPQWHAMISIAALASDGRERVHEWSKSYAGYTADETDAYINRAIEMQRPCSCRYIMASFPGYCPKQEGKKCPCDVNAPIRFCVLSKEEQLKALIDSKPDADTLLLDDNIALASYARKKDAKLWIAFKAYLKTKDVNIGIQDYERAIKQYEKRQEEEQELSGRSQPKDLMLSGLDQFIESSSVETLSNLSDLTGEANAGAESIPQHTKIPFRTPAGWLVDSGGIWKESTDKDGDIVYIPVCSQPAVITKILDDLDDQLAYAEVSFPLRKKWRSVIVPRNLLMSKSKVVDLSANGLSVISDTAGNMNRYFRDFENLNDDVIPVYRYANRLGWVKSER